MNRFILYISVVFLVLSCSKTIDKPANLLPKETMASIIADFSINEQSYSLDTRIDNDNSTRYILKQYKTNGETFTASYKYYMLEPEKMTKILNQAQEIILEKNQKSKDYINKKIKDNPDIAPAMR